MPIFNLDKRKRKLRGEGEGGDYFKYFGQGGGGGGAIIRVRRLIEGRLLFKEIRCACMQGSVTENFCHSCRLT